MDRKTFLLRYWLVSLPAIALALSACQTPEGEQSRQSLEDMDLDDEDTATNEEAVSIKAELDGLPAHSHFRLHGRRICGFVLSKPMILDGEGARIVACPGSPAPVASLPDLKAGILIDPAAAGSIIRNFRFEGRGAASGKPKALAFGIFARGVGSIVVTDNLFRGTIQAITDAGGPGWVIAHNRIRKLEVLPCPGGCGGGDGIVVSHAATGTASSDHAVVLENQIAALPPPAGLPFAITGILAWSVVDPLLASNQVNLPGSPTIGIQFTRTAGGGVLIDAPCGNGHILDNDLSKAETGIALDDECAGGTQLLGNQGAVLPTLASTMHALTVEPAQPMRARPLGID